MNAWCISFVWEYDLEPVLKSRALGRFTDSLHIHLLSTHNTTPLRYPAWEIWNDAARLPHKRLVVDMTVSTAWTGLCYDSTLYYQICTFNWWRWWLTDRRADGWRTHRTVGLACAVSTYDGAEMVFWRRFSRVQACFEGLVAARKLQCKIDFDPPLEYPLSRVRDSISELSE